MKQNIILEKSFDFALAIVYAVRELQEQRREYILSKQLLRSGTSIGANAEEAMGASSSRDFAYKLEIAYREARETRYWLRLLISAQYLPSELARVLLNDCEELLKILTSILVRVKNKQDKTS